MLRYIVLSKLARCVELSITISAYVVFVFQMIVKVIFSRIIWRERAGMANIVV